MMRSALRLLLLGVFVSLCAPAYAVFQLDPIGGYECAENLSTEDCFSDATATGFSGPTTTTCTASCTDKASCTYYNT